MDTYVREMPVIELEWDEDDEPTARHEYTDLELLWSKLVKEPGDERA